MKKDHAPIIFAVAVTTLVGLTVAAVIFSYGWTVSVGGKIDDFTKTAAVWLTLLTCVLTAGVSTYVAYRQRSASTDLEGLKGQLATNLEFLKARLSAERKAYDELFAAAVVYYYTLASLEIGAWKSSRIGPAEDAMLAACRYIIAVENKHRDLWFKIWQKSRELSDTAGELKTKDSQKTFWRTNAKEYGNLLTDFQTAAASKHEEVPAKSPFKLISGNDGK